MITPPPPSPPRWATTLLRLRGLGARQTEVAADLRALHDARVRSHGPGYARRRYWRDVLSLWRPRVVMPVLSRPASASALVAEAGRDLVHAARLFRHQPGVLGAALLGLGLALGVTTAIFSVANAAIFRQVGVTEPAALTRVVRSYANGSASTLSYAEYRFLREHAQTSTLEAISSGQPQVELGAVAGGEASFITVSFVSGTLFSTLSGPPGAGRLITPADDRPGAPRVAVMSDWYWRRARGADPSVIGTTVAFNGASFTIVGIAARDFRGPTDTPPPFWVPLAACPEVFRGSDLLEPRGTETVNAWARLRPGVTLTQAQQELSALSLGIAADLVDAPGVQRNGIRLDPAGWRFSGAERSIAWIGAAVVLMALGLILLLACINLTNLLLAGATTRQREIGLRLALGATRGRVIRQLLTESVALGVMAGAAGWLFTLWALPLLAAAARIPPSVNLTLDTTVFAFLAVATIVAGTGAGLAPAFRGTTRAAAALGTDTARAGGHAHGHRLRGRLIGVQASACVVLLVSAALLTRSVTEIARVDLGFDAGRLVVVSPGLDVHGYDAARSAVFFERARTAIAATPGVVAVSLVLNPPLGNRNWTGVVTHQGRSVTIHHNQVTPDYFATIGLRLVRGRNFAAASPTPGAKDVIVCASLAAAVAGGGNPIGARVDPLGGGAGEGTIVGVVADARTADVRGDEAWYIYRPMPAGDQTGVSIIARAAANPAALVAPVQNAVRAIDPAIRPAAVLVTDSLQQRLEDVRLFATVAVVLGALALGLALTGMYGLTTFAVARRRREMGVRVAIGATNRQVLRVLVQDTLRPIVLGLVCGVVVAVPVARLLSGVLVGVTGGDPLAWMASVGLLAGTAVAAILVPARRILGINPAVVLREL